MMRLTLVPAPPQVVHLCEKGPQSGALSFFSIKLVTFLDSVLPTRGVQRINKGIQKFKKISEDVQKGVEECQYDIDENTREIQELEAINQELKQERTKGETLIRNLKNIIPE